MPNKKILIISRVKSTKYGDSTRPYYLGEGLQKNGYDVTNFCFVKKEENNVSYINFFQPGKDKLKNIWSHYQKLKQLIHCDYDYVYGHQLLGGLLGVIIKIRILKNTFLIVDAHTSETLENSFSPNTTWIKSFIVNHLEAYTLRKADSIITVSKESFDEFIKLKVNFKKIKIIKNGSTPEQIFNTEKSKKLIAKHNLENYKIGVFVNPRDNFFSNHLADDLINEWATSLYRQDPSIKILIIGGGEQHKHPSPNIIYSGFVKEFNDYLNLADFFLAIYPENAVCGGTRNKVCDYIMLSKPIISTKEGVRGFNDLLKNIHYLEVKTESDFIKNCVDLVTDNEKHKTLSKNISLLKKEYTWDHSIQQLVKLFNSFSNI